MKTRFPESWKRRHGSQEPVRGCLTLSIACPLHMTLGQGSTRARQVAGIEWRAGLGLARNTGTGLARVPEGAAVAVAARSPVRLGGIGACACAGIAGAGIVTLIQGRARHRVCAHAASGHAGVALRASVAVAARSAIGLGWVRAHAGCGVARSDSVALIAGAAGYRIFPCADAF